MSLGRVTLFQLLTAFFATGALCYVVYHAIAGLHSARNLKSLMLFFGALVLGGFLMHTSGLLAQSLLYSPRSLPNVSCQTLDAETDFYRCDNWPLFFEWSKSAYEGIVAALKSLLQASVLSLAAVVGAITVKVKMAKAVWKGPVAIMDAIFIGCVTFLTLALFPWLTTQINGLLDTELKNLLQIDPWMETTTRVQALRQWMGMIECAYSQTITSYVDIHLSLKAWFWQAALETLFAVNSGMNLCAGVITQTLLLFVPFFTLITLFTAGISPLRPVRFAGYAAAFEVFGRLQVLLLSLIKIVEVPALENCKDILTDVGGVGTAVMGSVFLFLLVGITMGVVVYKSVAAIFLKEFTESRPELTSLFHGV